MIASPYIAELLTVEKFEHYWPNIARQLDRVPDTWDTWWTKEAIHDLTTAGRFQCWTVGTEAQVCGVAFSQIAMYPAANSFQVFLAFGEGMPKMIDALEAAFHRFAIMSQCTIAEVSGRLGWEPLLKPKGFRRSSAIWVKKIEPMGMH